ncbi:MAG: hypothetical protein KKH67_12520, partial [candidate division Zixibacteria bacterium]|nr:hypothetical protein [candidate division Zixibacteria bacterium]
CQDSHPDSYPQQRAGNPVRKGFLTAHGRSPRRFATRDDDHSQYRDFLNKQLRGNNKLMISNTSSAQSRA